MGELQTFYFSLSCTHLSSSNYLPLSLSLHSSLFLTWAGTPILFKVAATMRTDILSPYDTRASFVRGVSSPIYLMPSKKGESYVSWHVEKNEEQEKYKHHITYFISLPPLPSSYVNIDISQISNNGTTYPHQSISRRTSNWCHRNEHQITWTHYIHKNHSKQIHLTINEQWSHFTIKKEKERKTGLADILPVWEIFRIFHYVNLALQIRNTKYK